jgi:hypothetical protein
MVANTGEPGPFPAGLVPPGGSIDISDSLFGGTRFTLRLLR